MYGTAAKEGNKARTDFPHTRGVSRDRGCEPISLRQIEAGVHDRVFLGPFAILDVGRRDERAIRQQLDPGVAVVACVTITRRETSPDKSTVLGNVARGPRPDDVGAAASTANKSGTPARSAAAQATRVECFGGMGNRMTH